MNKNIKGFLVATAVILIATLIYGVVVSILKINDVTDTSFIINVIFSLIIFAIAAIVFGLIVKKGGFIKGFIVALIYLLLIIIFQLFSSDKSLDLVEYLLIGAKSIILLVGSIIGVNMSNQKTTV